MIANYEYFENVLNEYTTLFETSKELSSLIYILSMCNYTKGMLDAQCEDELADRFKALASKACDCLYDLYEKTNN